MFDAWAGTAGISLFPGTVFLCAEEPLHLPAQFISLDPCEHLHAANYRRAQEGYSPRLYPVSLGNCIPAWVFRWSEDDSELGFLGDLPDCEPLRLLEVIAPFSLKVGFGVERLTLRFLAEDAAAPE
jgi:hypothetical protein